MPWVRELRTSSRARTAFHCIAVGVGYYVGGRIGLALKQDGAAISALWPPNAILLAALLGSSTRTWPLLLAAVLPAHLIAQLHDGVPLSMALCWYVSNCSEALIGAMLVRRADADSMRLDTIRRVGIFLLGAAVAAPFLSSFLDAGFVELNHFGTEDYWEAWQSRFTSNVLAVLTIAPAIVTPYTGWRTAENTPRTWRPIEATLMAAGLLGVCWFVFLSPSRSVTGPALAYAPMPFLLWAAVRFGPASVSTSLVAVALMAIWGATNGRGPFAGAQPGDSVIPLQIFLILTDVPMLALTALLAERAAASDRSQRTATQLQLALSSSKLGAWDWDMKSDALELSEEYCEFYGLPPSALPKKPLPLVDLSEPADQAKMLESMRLAVERGVPVDMEFRIRRVDGATRWLRVRGAVIRDSEGHPARMVGVTSDETDRRRIEAESLTQRRELAHLGRVAVLGELAGALAHELKQPLTAILANTRAAQAMLRRYMPDEAELRAILDDVVADDLRASAVIQRVRRLIKKGTTEPTTVSANDVVYEVLDLAHADLAQRGVTAVPRLAPDLPSINADRIQLQQVLLNLLVNACDAMAENPPSDRVVTITTATRDRMVSISVSDKGTGIPAESLESVFDPFMTTKEQGLGLGLSICRSILTAHEGRIWATNNPDRGATIALAIPVAASKANINRASAPREAMA